MTNELDTLHKTHTWDMIALPPRKFAVGCKWVYKIKTRTDGSVECYKARLVVKGFTQEYGMDYEETCAPVARFTSVRSLLAIVMVCHLPLFQMDVKYSFLNGDLLEEVYMQPPPVMWLLNRVSLLIHMIQPSSFDKPSMVTSSFDGYYLSQAKYTSDLLSKAGITNSKTASSPLELNVKLNATDGEPLSDNTLYRQLVGNLIDLTVTRPDLTYVVHLSSLELCAYGDANWAGDPTNRHSITGYCFLLGSSLIYGRSKQQFVVAHFCTEAEYRALVDATSELLRLRWLLTDMDAPQTTSTPIHCDNHSAIHISHNDVFHEHIKHIEIDCHFICHHLQQHTFHLLSVCSKDQLVDVFIKSHPSGRLRDFFSKLKMASSTPPCV
uniref:Reverse transcriptase Ty1/copia-type domain-containing protein n=1 Tax=Fagus sylvatica TaxID=28930 RepID=A0A2N9ENJ2_FAGSY